MALPEVLSPPPLTTDATGTVRVGGSRVALESVVAAFDEGASAEEITARYPALELATVYATLTYRLQHRTEVEEYLRDREQVADGFRREADRRFPPDDLRARLLNRRPPS